MYSSHIQVKKKRGVAQDWLAWENNQGSSPESKTGSAWGQPNQQNLWEQPNQWGGPSQNDPWVNSQFQGNQPISSNSWGQPGDWGNSGGIGNQQQLWGNHLTGKEWQHAQAKEQNFSFLNLQSMDLANYLEQQIVQIEESPAKKKLQELKKNGQKFMDDRFPPNNNSLCGEWKNLPQWKDVKWAKISSALPGCKIFTGKPLPMDIKQGFLGDCYFLAGLAAICERPDRVYNLFLLQEQNAQNYYSMKILYQGKWMTIDVDEMIPFLHDAPAFSKSVDKELWVILLEKAWAKLYTSYKRIEAGYPQEPLHDLTGAPIKEILIRKGGNNKEQEWNYLLKATQLQYAMVCSSNPGSDSDQSQSGVVQGHAYTLLAAVILNFQGQQHRLIKLRNPWGKGEFKGQWSDYDQNWNYIDAGEKQRIGYSSDKNDGIFFIPFDNFWQEFRSVTIAEINDNASYLYKSVKDPKKEGCYFKIQIKKQGVYSLQVDKTPERSFEDKRQDHYNYPTAKVELCSFMNGKVTMLQGFQSNARTTFLKYKMSPGVYIAKVRVEFDPQYQTDFEVNLAIYAEFPCIISLASNQEASAMAGQPVNWSGKQTAVHQSWNKQAAWGFHENQGNNQPGFQQNQSWGNGSGWGNGNGSGSGWGNNPVESNGPNPYMENNYGSPPNQWGGGNQWGAPNQWGNQGMPNQVQGMPNQVQGMPNSNWGNQGGWGNSSGNGQVGNNPGWNAGNGGW